jgi:hypothetical protein
MNVQYKWARTGMEDDPLPLSYQFEEREKSRPAPEREDKLEKIWELAGKSPAPADDKPITIEPKAGALGAKIKEAMQSDFDPEESLAAIRAILVGPSRRLHDARIEEIVSILEETDRSNQSNFTALERRCQGLSERLDQEIKKATDLQLQYLAEFSFALEKKFDHSQAELNGQLAEQASHSQAAIGQLSHEFKVKLKDHDHKVEGGFESLTAKFEQRFLKLDEYADELQQRSAEVFVEGLHDIAKRLTALKRNGK